METREDRSNDRYVRRAYLRTPSHRETPRAAIHGLWLRGQTGSPHQSGSEATNCLRRCPCPRTLPFIWTENTPYSSAVRFRISFNWDPPELWLEELQKFLTGWSATFRCLESTVCLCELICEAFAAKVGYPDYLDCCSGAGGFFVFVTRLKDAKIEWFEGYHHGGPLDWSTMCSLLRIEVWIRAEWWD
ncbi:hypothetical protein CRG98_016052 [Punica granatum]|uniref:Uncharacterized protein n=1 Tax=Punica granatum TaxID=22663 RepID=A0A2I0K4S1_PUNGR|nr:hypothetical protein CRG98_016052 [Punica granatum]